LVGPPFSVFAQPPPPKFFNQSLFFSPLWNLRTALVPPLSSPVCVLFPFSHPEKLSLFSNFRSVSPSVSLNTGRVFFLTFFHPHFFTCPPVRRGFFFLLIRRTPYPPQPWGRFFPPPIVWKKVLGLSARPRFCALRL